jgi:DNA-binding CsgD family transcriptional regulator
MNMSATSPIQIFGRDAEVAALLSTVESVSERGASVVLRGEAGIGKSYLIGSARQHAEARGMRVIATAGVESEAKLPLAGLHTLLRPVLPMVSRLPAPQREAMNVAFGLSAGDRPELFLVALATLSLLCEIASERPLLVVVDDAQWLDESTASVLVFVARRLSSDPVVMLTALRDGYSTPFDAPDMTAMSIDRLDEAAVRSLLAATWPDLSVTARERVITAAAGSPLALAELPRALAPDHRKGAAALPETLRLTAQLEQAFLERFDQLPETTRSTLLIAALNENDSLVETLAAVEHITGGLTADPLLPAARHGLVHLDAEVLRFRHPLVRSAITQAATPAQRQVAHQALAEVIDASDHRRSVWHRAAATFVPDEQIALLLEENARESVERGGVASAVAAFSRAAELSSDRAAQGRRWLGAAELALELGDAERTSDLLKAAENRPLEAHDQARVAWLREATSPDLGGGPQAIAATVGRALQIARSGEVELAMRILTLCAWNAFNLDTAGSSAGLFLGALKELDVPENDPRVVAILGYVDPVRSGRRVIRTASAYADGAGIETDAIYELLNSLGTVGALPTGEALFATAIDRLRSRGMIRQLSQLLMEASHAWFLVGRVKSAQAAAEESLQLAYEAQLPPIWSGATNSLLALLAGARGEYALAAQLADQAGAAALALKSRCLWFLTQNARGVNELSAGNYERAYHELERLFDPSDPTHHSFWSYFAIGDLAEAALAIGREHEVRDLMTSIEPLTASGSTWLSVSFQYASYLMADDCDAERLYQTALEAELGSWPFHRARLHLAHGIWLRRHRRRADSRPVLRQALEIFEALEAHPWAMKARQELLVAGAPGEAPKADLVSMQTLTAQELQVAQLAADGLSNREIGERLFLSPRTVGSHLYRIFPKLDISSRNQLGKALRRILSEHETGAPM